ncbi:MAG TPA: EAL domain-containing protein [Gammaproteobacteria bacterium]|jgi:diguanylate cyclase (GGDEF)-like protein|nr:EAL domain-containing protein [Gammaproteobacteria bacterium]
MAFMFFVLVCSLIVLCWGCYSLKSKNQTKQLIVKLQHAELELKKAKEMERQIREERILLEEKLHYTFEDPITHLLGWQVFEDRLNQTVKESARYQFIPGILFVDVDDFKTINSALGYKVGDTLLQEVGQRLQACIRQVDSVSRFTKDTFVVLLAQLARAETAAIVAQRILQTMTQPFQIQEHALCISVCIGIAIYPTDGQDAATLMRSADYALLVAKEKGKNTYQFYQEKTHADSQRVLLLSNGLNQETVFENFIIRYQPIMHIKTKKTICMEALLYWQHTELGLIEPAELFLFAEKQNKLNVISEWLLVNACRQFLHWRTLEFNPELFSIPISTKQLENSHFVYRISQILQEMKCRPEWLLLTIRSCKEVAYSDDLEKAFNMLKYLRVKIAIDGVGLGAFPLFQIKKINAQYFKLAPLLWWDGIENNEKATLDIIEAVLFLAKKMSAQVMVQDVETATQMQLLTKLGCLLMQGTAISPPLAEQEVVVKMVNMTA